MSSCHHSWNLSGEQVSISSSEIFAASFYHCPPIPFVWSSPALFVFLSLSHLFFPSEYALHSSEMSFHVLGPCRLGLFWCLCKWQCLAFQMSQHHSREWISGDLHFVLSQDAKVDLVASLLSAARHSAAEFVTSEDSPRCSGLEGFCDESNLLVDLTHSSTWAEKLLASLILLSPLQSTLAFSCKTSQSSASPSF